MEWDPSSAIPVSSIAEEYRVVGQARCPCGGRLRVIRQALLLHEQRPYDLLEAVCVECGQRQEYLFDIGAFFGKTLWKDHEEEADANP
jgi:hypothetical protein